LFPSLFESGIESSFLTASLRGGKDKTMFKPKITEEWLLATMELEGDGFINAGGIRSEMPECDDVNDDAAQENPVPPFRIAIGSFAPAFEPV
jgi:hypothetical protein